jgi:hypothetical protein
MKVYKYHIFVLCAVLINFVLPATAQNKPKEKPRPFTQIKVNDYFTLDNKEFVCVTTLQYGEVIIGDTMDVYTTKGLMGKCRIIELENPYTEEKITIKHAVASVKVTAKAFNCSIDEQCYLVSKDKLPYGVRIHNPPKKIQKDTLKTVTDTLNKAP